jgi:cardiolipin synthase
MEWKVVGTIPNLLSLLRLLLLPLILESVLTGNYWLALCWLLLAGLSDALDGWLARLLHQQTRLGEYLDPIVDKIMLSSLFLALSLKGLVPWSVTSMVLFRDISMLAAAWVLYNAKGMRDFHPTLAGKLNTVVQIATVLVVLLSQYNDATVIFRLRGGLFIGTQILTVVSGCQYALRYILQLRQRARAAQSDSEQH